MKSCSVSDCQQQHHSKGYCRRHYELEIRGTGRSVQKHRRDENLKLLETGCKRCSRCREVKGLDEFSPKRDCLGGFRAECKSCMYLLRSFGQGRELRRQAAERRNRRAGARSIAEFKNQQHERRAAKEREQQSRIRAHEIRIATQPWLDPVLSQAQKYRLRYKLDNGFAIKERVRRQIKKAEKKLGISDKLRAAIDRNGSSPSTEEVIGYPVSELRLHLERQFTKGMSWDRFKEGKIHIDHILPVASFDLSKQSEVRACWSLANLRPLWAEHNLSKGARVESLL